MFTVQPNVYFEGMDPSKEEASLYADEASMKEQALNPATVTVGIVALGIVAVAGSATAIYYEVREEKRQQSCHQQLAGAKGRCTSMDEQCVCLLQHT